MCVCAVAGCVVCMCVHNCKKFVNQHILEVFENQLLKLLLHNTHTTNVYTHTHKHMQTQSDIHKPPLLSPTHSHIQYMYKCYSPHLLIFPVVL